ncbi:hypothetical protein FSP39_001218 [Pinctada imbricata]|uniref:Uncharacterized protein n=1 Tax=Pinctada imbricata TaxID=66713 RepID=A0AA88YP93_PINIB|nr:hypothetical protein FSP39_001218 [Pinctada imbricata]
MESDDDDCIYSPVPQVHSSDEEDEDEAPKLHHKEILLKLNELRKIQKYCDATVTILGRRHFVHRNVLAASSPAFDESLYENDYLGMCNIVLVHDDLHNVEETLTDEIIDFLYTGDLTVKEKHLDLLCNLADTLKIRPLIDKLEEFLKNRIRNNFEKFVETFVLVKKYQSLNISTSTFRTAFCSYQFSSLVDQIRDLSPNLFDQFLDNFKKYLRPPKILCLIFHWIYFNRGQEYLKTLFLNHVEMHSLTEDMYYEIRNYEGRYGLPENLTSIIWKHFVEEEIDMGSILQRELSEIHRLARIECTFKQSTCTVEGDSEELIYSPIALYIDGSSEKDVMGDMSHKDNSSLQHQMSQTDSSFEHFDLSKGDSSSVSHQMSQTDCSSLRHQMSQTDNSSEPNDISNGDSSAVRHHLSQTDSSSVRNHMSQTDCSVRHHMSKTDSSSEQYDMSQTDCSTLRHHMSQYDSSSAQDDSSSVRHLNVEFQQGSEDKMPSSHKRKGNPRKLKKGVKVVRTSECRNNSTSEKESSDINHYVILKDIKTEKDDPDFQVSKKVMKDEDQPLTEWVVEGSTKDLKLELPIVADDSDVDTDATNPVSPLPECYDSESYQEMQSESINNDSRKAISQNKKQDRPRSNVEKEEKKDINKTKTVQKKKASKKKEHKKKSTESSSKQEKDAQNLSIQCEFCDVISTSTDDYYKHLKIHLEGPPFKCNVCEVTRNSVRDLMIHQYKHSSERKFTCEDCGKKFKYPSGLKGHMKRHRGEIMEKKFICDVCDKRFETDRLLEAHKLIHGSERPFLCDFCGFSSKSKSHLSSHQRIHTGRVFKCDFPDCSYFSPIKGALERHQKSVHLQKRDYQCTTCGKIFLHEQTLARHESIHTGFKPYKCTECWYATHRKDKFNEHMRKWHGDNPTGKRKLPVPQKMRQELEAQGWIEKKEKDKQQEMEPDFSMLISHVASRLDGPKNSFIPGMDSYGNFL